MITRTGDTQIAKTLKLNHMIIKIARILRQIIRNCETKQSKGKENTKTLSHKIIKLQHDFLAKSKA